MQSAPCTCPIWPGVRITSVSFIKNSGFFFAFLSTGFSFAEASFSDPTWGSASSLHGLLSLVATSTRRKGQRIGKKEAIGDLGDRRARPRRLPPRPRRPAGRLAGAPRRLAHPCQEPVRPGAERDQRGAVYVRVKQTGEAAWHTAPPFFGKDSESTDRTGRVRSCSRFRKDRDRSSR